MARRGGLRWDGWDWLACGGSSSRSSGSTGSYSSSILTDLLHKIPHKVRWKGAYDDGEKKRISKMSFSLSGENMKDFRTDKKCKSTKIKAEDSSLQKRFNCLNALKIREKKTDWAT